MEAIGEEVDIHEKEEEHDARESHAYPGSVDHEDFFVRGVRHVADCNGVPTKERSGSNLGH